MTPVSPARGSKHLRRKTAVAIGPLPPSFAAFLVTTILDIIFVVACIASTCFARPLPSPSLTPNTMARRQHLTLLVALAIAAFLSISYLFGRDDRELAVTLPRVKDGALSATASAVDLFGEVPSGILAGGSIAPKLKNETAKYARTGTASQLRPALSALAPPVLHHHEIEANLCPLQSRTRARVMEALPHDDGTFP